eukprot:GEMP01005321.1.p1 GENE.GEMP01005321.1~~GEMP01005321.1.p1  ORF type:complete len:693 (-),score=158.48 GEMP01005321.1:1373-3451(-)
MREQDEKENGREETRKSEQERRRDKEEERQRAENEREAERKRANKIRRDEEEEEEEEEEEDAEEKVAIRRANLIRRTKIVHGKIGSECKLAALPSHVKADFMKVDDCIEFLTRPKLYKTVKIETGKADRKYRGFCLRFGDITMCVAIAFESSLNNDEFKIVNDDDSTPVADQSKKRTCVCIPFLGTRYGFRGLKFGEALVKHMLHYYKGRGIVTVLAPVTASALKFWQRLMFCAPRSAVPLKFHCFRNTTTLHLHTPSPNILYPRLPSANELIKLMRVSAHFMHFNADNVDRMEHIALAVFPGEQFLGSTLVHEAVKMKPELRRKCGGILETKYTFNERDLTGRIALHYAVRHNDVALIEWLVKCKSNVNAKDNRGQVAISFAAKYNCLEVVNKLISYGALVTKKDANGTTPLDIAVKGDVEGSHVETIKVLRIAYDEQKGRELAKVAQGVSSMRETSARVNATAVPPKSSKAASKKRPRKAARGSTDNAHTAVVSIVSDTSDDDDDHNVPNPSRSSTANRIMAGQKRQKSSATPTNGSAAPTKRRRMLPPAESGLQKARKESYETGSTVRNRAKAVLKKAAPKKRQDPPRPKVKKKDERPALSAADFEAMQLRALDKMVSPGQRINKESVPQKLTRKTHVSFKQKLAELEAGILEISAVKRNTTARRTILKTGVPDERKNHSKTRRGKFDG